MSKFVFVTGNEHKVEWLKKFLGHDVSHKKVEVEELQSPIPADVLEHKAREAYKIIKKPVVVDDVSLVFKEWGDMPGTFIKFFVEGPGLEKICRMLDGFSSREAIMRVSYGYFDGKKFQMVSSLSHGEIAKHPADSAVGHGFDPILIPEGHAHSYGAMKEETYILIHPRGQAVKQLKLLLQREGKLTKSDEK